MRNTKRVVGVRLPDELRKRIETLAKKERRTLSDYVRLVLEDHVRKGVAA